MARPLFSPAAFSLLLTVFREEQQRNQIGTGAWTAVAACGFVAGLILGGIITDLFGWRWVLWINVPIGIIVMLLVRALPLGLPNEKEKSERLDIYGALLACNGRCNLGLRFRQ